MSKRHPVSSATRCVLDVIVFLKALIQCFSLAQILLAAASCLAFTVLALVIPPPVSTPLLPRCSPELLTPALVGSVDQDFYATHPGFPRDVPIELWDQKSIKEWWQNCDRVLLQRQFHKRRPIVKQPRNLNAKGRKDVRQKSSREDR